MVGVRDESGKGWESTADVLGDDGGFEELSEQQQLYGCCLRRDFVGRFYSLLMSVVCK